MKTDLRREERSQTYAKVILLDNNTPGYLRDLSKQGCKISLLNPVTVLKDDVILFKIVPDDENNIPAFQLSLRVFWTRYDLLYFSIGGTVILPQEEENKENLNRIYNYYAGINQ
ncbi:MAG: hypothetical protein GH155_03990 [Spirochaeta sp.]|nr:hypothetical protein [Spirochaeta sp.]